MHDNVSHLMGRGGYCQCPKCSVKIFHRTGIPCQEEKCPQCGSKMLRVDSYHHQLWLKKQKSKIE